MQPTTNMVVEPYSLPADEAEFTEEAAVQTDEPQHTEPPVFPCPVPTESIRVPQTDVLDMAQALGASFMVGAATGALLYYAFSRRSVEA